MDSSHRCADRSHLHILCNQVSHHLRMPAAVNRQNSLLFNSGQCLLMRNEILACGKRRLDVFVDVLLFVSLRLFCKQAKTSNPDPHIACCRSSPEIRRYTHRAHRRICSAPSIPLTVQTPLLHCLRESRFAFSLSCRPALAAVFSNCLQHTRKIVGKRRPKRHALSSRRVVKRERICVQ